MAISFDAFSSGSPGTGDLTWVHTPAGSPRGALVFIMQNTSASDQVDSVTYGGVPLLELASPLLRSTGESGGVYAYGIGRGISSGSQTVSVVASGSATKVAGCITVTGNRPIVLTATNSSINSTSIVSPSSTLALGGKSSFVAMGFHSGVNTVGGITPRTGWTSRYEYDYGTQTAGIYTYNTIDSSDVIIGWTQLADDALAIGVAIRELIPSVYTRIKTMSTGIAIDRNGVLHEFARNTLPERVTEEQVRAALEQRFSDKLDDFHIHINDDYTIAFATGDSPPNVWPEDEVEPE